MAFDQYRPMSRDDVLILHYDRSSQGCGDPDLFRRQVMWWEASSYVEIKDRPDVKEALAKWDPSIENTPEGQRPEEWVERCTFERFSLLVELHANGVLKRKSVSFEDDM